MGLLEPIGQHVLQQLRGTQDAVAIHYFDIRSHRINFAITKIPGAPSNLA